MDFVKGKTKEAALSSYRTYNSNVPQNLSNNKLIALQNLSKNKDLIIQKLNDGNSVLILDRPDYLNEWYLKWLKEICHSRFKR